MNQKLMKVLAHYVEAAQQRDWWVTALQLWWRDLAPILLLHKMDLYYESKLIIKLAT